MRFHPRGPDIPSELLAAQQRGEVVFICGAGISMQVQLPSFRQLVQSIYQELGESWVAHPAEEQGMSESSPAYDRVVRSLERRGGGNDPSSVQRIRERIRAAVRKSLVPPDGPLSAHYHILFLSRDAELRHRVVTTNFDTLFERAWKREHPTAIALKSHAGPDLPGPRAAGFTGILHVHGRIGDADLSLEETDLVLTSAEFGEAYLRAGWAARYVYDLVRALIVVIVGYTADDPPMRYLLDVIDADRERFHDLRDVYAFVPAKDGDEATQRALWEAKGAIPIIYRVSDHSDHSSLYRTLEQWSLYAADPTDWRTSQLKPLLSTSPTTTAKDDIEQIRWLLGGGDAADILEEINPSPTWMPKFAEMHILKDAWHPRLPWIVNNLSNKEMLKECLNLRFSRGQIQLLQMEMLKQQGKINPVIYHGWRLLFRARTNAFSTEQVLGNIFDVHRKLKAGDVGYDFAKLLCAILRPRLQLGTALRLKPIETDEQEFSLEDLLTVDFGSDIEQAGLHELDVILNDIPKNPDVEFELADQLARELLDALDEAVDANFISPTYDRASSQIPSVARHTQNQYGRGFYGFVRLVTDLWERAAPADIQRARKFTTWCLGQRHVVLKRMGLHFLSIPQVHCGADASVELLALSDELFWRQARREQMRLIAERWNDFPTEHRERLEARLLLGLPKELFPKMTADREPQFRGLRDHAIFTRLTRIAQAGGQLSDKAKFALTDLKTQNPDFAVRPDDQEDFDVWLSGGFRGPRGDTSKLKDVETNQLVQEAIRIEAEQPWEQGDLWSVFCKDEPGRARTAMEAQADAGHWSPAAWRPFLEVFCTNEDTEAVHSIILLLLRAPDKFIVDLMFYVTHWIERQRSIIITDKSILADAFNLWDRLAHQVYGDFRLAAPDNESNVDIMSDTLSGSGGVLAAFLTQLLQNLKLAKDMGLPTDIKARATIAVHGAGRSGILARVNFAQFISYLDISITNGQKKTWSDTSIGRRKIHNFCGAGVHTIATRDCRDCSIC